MTPETIHEIRQRWHVTQEDFARRIGVSVRTVQRWEAGISQPRPRARKMLERWGKAE